MYRTGTYVAFDGLGLQAWNANKRIDFKITNSHEKTYAVRDSSKKATLYARIQERLRASKNMLVVISKDTRKSGSVLSYEIGQAIDVYKIPLIIAYPDFSAIWGVDSDLSVMWPTALLSRIDGAGVEAIHIAFKKEPILDSIERFTVNGERLSSGRNCYSKESYIKWGILK